jgi:MerR family transcriptional regulator/heat shock protein HspR
MSNQKDAVYIISVAAELVGMHPQTLRVYERRGLLDPYRTPGGTRRYSQEDLDRLRLIQDLSNAGVNLEGTKRILKLQNENAQLSGQVSRLRRLLENSETRWGGGHSETLRVSVRRTANLPAIRKDNQNRPM